MKLSRILLTIFYKEIFLLKILLAQFIEQNYFIIFCSKQFISTYLFSTTAYLMSVLKGNIYVDINLEKSVTTSLKNLFDDVLLLYKEI